MRKFIVCAAVSLSLCLFAGPARKVSVLFVGNSLTYTNDLPGTLQRFGAAAPPK